MITTQTLEEVKNRLIKTYNPIQIYLFGSYAWGHPTEDSDLDLAVIIDMPIIDAYRLLVEGHKALIGLDVSKDLLVYSKQDFENRAQDTTSLCYEIKQKGKIIYAKA